MPESAQNASTAARVADPSPAEIQCRRLGVFFDPLCPLVVRVAAIVPRDPWTVKKWARLTAPPAGLRVVPP
jgi:hypothetical protein